MQLKKNVKLIDPVTGGFVDVPGTAVDAAAEAAAAAEAKAAAAAGPPPVKQGPKPLTVGVFGLTGAGKSTMVVALNGDPDPKPTKTIGFRRHNMTIGGDVDVKIVFYDMPGSMQKKWEGYTTDVHGAIYVVDAAADEAQWAKSVAAYKKFDAECAKFVDGKPMLVVANKQDLEGARGPEAVSEELGLAGREHTEVLGVTAHPKRHTTGEVDERAERGLMWVVDAIKGRYDELRERVVKDEANREAEEFKAKLEREKRVFCTILRNKAFPEEGEPVECMSLEDGLEFIADETGELQEELPPVVEQICRLVNNHKVALTMCGGLKKPVSKKKKKHSWDEIIAYVKERRAEAGLPDEL